MADFPLFQRGAHHPRSIDRLRGAALFTVGMTAALFALAVGGGESYSWTSPFMLGLMIGSVVFARVSGGGEQSEGADAAAPSVQDPGYYGIDGSQYSGKRAYYRADHVFATVDSRGSGRQRDLVGPDISPDVDRMADRFDYQRAPDH